MKSPDYTCIRYIHVYNGILYIGYCKVEDRAMDVELGEIEFFYQFGLPFCIILQTRGVEIFDTDTYNPVSCLFLFYITIQMELWT